MCCISTDIAVSVATQANTSFWIIKMQQSPIFWVEACCGGVSGDVLWRRVQGRVVEACPGTCCGGVSGDVLWRRVRGRVVEASPGPVPGGLEGVRVEL
ncbi:unnamed protein product [Arctogadus glacialis]